MYRIKTLNKISSVGLSQLDKSRFLVDNDVNDEDGILVRSADMPAPTTSPWIAAAKTAS